MECPNARMPGMLESRILEYEENGELFLSFLIKNTIPIRVSVLFYYCVTVGARGRDPPKHSPQFLVCSTQIFWSHSSWCYISVISLTPTRPLLC